MDGCKMDHRFLHNLPKIELHAHLNGSLNFAALLELGTALYGGSTPEFFELAAAKVSRFDNYGLDDCFLKFKFVHELTATERGLELATQLAIRDFANDNVVYLELRTTPKANEYMTRRTYLETVLRGIAQFKESADGGGIMVKLLPSIDRGQPVAAAEEMLQIVLSLREQHPNVIVGIDLSGDPKYGRFEDFKPVLQLARDNGLKLALHCAEIENTLEVADIIEFGMDRCGHGTFLTAPQIARLGKERTAIECCLTSNVKSGTVAGYLSHHFRGICEQGDVPVVLCTDDSGVFDTTLTKELEIAVATFDLPVADVKRIMLYAVEYSFTENLMEKKYLSTLVSNYFEQQGKTTTAKRASKL